MANHTVEIPDKLWAYFQQQSGKSNPASAIREALYEHRISHGELAPPTFDVAPPVVDLDRIAERRKTLGIQPDNFDRQFMHAYDAWVQAHKGDEDEALAWLENACENRNMKSPRSWMISWYKDSQQSA